MLILAGVSLNAIVGDNGIITMAQKAKEQYEFAAICEELETMMFEFNTTGETGSSSLKAYMNKQVENGKIDSFKTVRKDNSMNFVIEKDGHMFYAVPDGGEYWKVVSTEEGANELTELAIEVYTTSNVNANGTFDLGQAGKETDVVFYEGINDYLNFEIKQGIVNIYIYDDMYLSNEGVTPARSAIDIHEGATLNLYLEEGARMEVDSGVASGGEAATGWDAQGGAGGFAGIHVPSTSKGEATFNLYGDGTLIAIGGDAGRGVGSQTPGNSNTGGGRRWSEPVLVLVGNGGAGGAANGTISNEVTGSGHDGEPGEDAGNINIYNSVTVKAYGGAGGGTNKGIGWGAGVGRWADILQHGIGRRRSWRRSEVIMPAAGGGYCGGGAEDHADLENSDNGYGISVPQTWGTGGSYFENGKVPDYPYSDMTNYACIGGQGGSRITGWCTQGGDGGVAGKGGTVIVSRNALVYAYNGNKYTDGKSEHGYSEGQNQLEIDIQGGKLRSIYKYSVHWNLKEYRYVSFFENLFNDPINSLLINPDINTFVGHTGTTTGNNYLIRSEFIEDLSTYPNRIIKSGYSNPETGSIYGVGSGAGYIELSNGTYTVDTTGSMD